jgi:guanylate kinase
LNREGRLIVISGPSGSGKSTIISFVLDRLDIDFSVSATTREARPGELNGVHYWFVTAERFREMISDGMLLEWAEYNNNLYGTPVEPIVKANSLGRDVLLDIEIEGARQVKENRPDSVMIFITTPSLEVLENRLRLRGDTTDADIGDRLRIAATQLQVAHELFDFVVVNDDLTMAIDEVASLITGPV